MPRYLKVAEEGQKFAEDIMTLIKGPMGEQEYAQVAELIARIANMAVRACPRGVQHTVRLNIVKTVCAKLPVRVSMVEKQDERTKRTYHALVTQPIVKSGADLPTSVEGANDDAE